jgi:hypothetical protein
LSRACFAKHIFEEPSAVAVAANKCFARLFDFLALAIAAFLVALELNSLSDTFNRIQKINFQIYKNVACLQLVVLALVHLEEIFELFQNLVERTHIGLGLATTKKTKWVEPEAASL